MNLPNPVSGYINIILFIPYYFSFGTLSSTFFTPWKRLYWKRTSRALILSDIAFVAVSNLFSRLIGMLLRVIILLLGLVVFIAAVVFGLPVALLAFVITTDSFIFNRNYWQYMRPIAWDWHYGYTPLTDIFSSELYYESLSYPLRGRDEEEETIRRILADESEKNILLVGQPGSGRRALLVSLAHKYATHRFLVFNAVGFLKDKKTAQESAGALEEILKECQSAGNIVLIIHGIERIAEYATTLERFIAHNEFHLVGTTTPTHYHNSLLPNKSLIKHFEIMDIDLLDTIEIVRILADHAKQSVYSGYFDQETLSMIVTASDKLEALEHKYQPEAAIDLFDDLLRFLNNNPKPISKEKIRSHVEWFLEERFHVPFGTLTQKEKVKLKHLEEYIHERVVNQDGAVTAISNALRARHLKLSNEKRPIGSFLFLGPTGVGKTETAKALASIFFEDPKKLIRFDMAQYQTSQDTPRLTKELARAIREDPYGVLLLDELEKAHSGIHNLFLTVLDEGYLPESEGSHIDCSSLIIIATSNAGSEYIRQRVSSDKQFIQSFEDDIINYVLAEHIFSPEFINRFDSVAVFTPLSDTHMRHIARMKLEKLNNAIAKNHKTSFDISDELLDKIVNNVSHKEFGAREIDRTIKKLVTNPLAQELLD